MYRMTSEWPWILNSEEYYVYTKLVPTLVRSISLYDQTFFRYNIAEHRKCTEWPQNCLTCQTYSINTKHLTMRNKLWSISLAYDQAFSRYKVVEKKAEMHQMTHGWPWTLSQSNQHRWESVKWHRSLSLGVPKPYQVQFSQMTRCLFILAIVPVPNTPL